MQRTVVVFAALLGIVSLLITPVATPAYLGTATSDSMAPTFQTGDAYVVVGADDVSVGDVVVFRSAERVGYVTHRVVDREASGFVTKGDANRATDQETGMAPVPRSSIVGEVLTVGGVPIVLPKLGSLVRFVDHNGVAVLAALVAVGVAIGVRDRTRRNPRKRSLLRVGDVVPPLLAGAIAISVAVVLLSSGSHVVFLEGEVSGAETTTMTLDGAAGPFSEVVVRAEGVTIEDRSVEDGRIRLELSVPPSSQGSAVRLDVRPYPRTVPLATLERLDRVHPLLAAATSVGIVLGPLALAYWLLLDPKQPLRSPLTRRAG